MLDKQLFSLIFLYEIKTISSFPVEGFVYETNPIQKLFYRYNHDGSTKPIQFKLQTVSFRVNEQLGDLDFDKNSKLESDVKIESKCLIGECESNNNIELIEKEKKYQQLSRFTVSYNTAEEQSIKQTNNTPDITIIRRNTTIPTSIATAKLTTFNSENSRSNNNSSNETTYLNGIPGTTENNPFDFDLTTEKIIDFTTDTAEMQTINQENIKGEHNTTSYMDIFDIDVTTENLIDSTTDTAEVQTIYFDQKNSNGDHNTTSNTNIISGSTTKNPKST